MSLKFYAGKIRILYEFHNYQTNVKYFVTELKFSWISDQIKLNRKQTVGIERKKAST